jgi:hypothetical protein
MAGRALRPEELAAGNIIAQQLRGVPVARNVLGAEDRTHDLDVVLPGGRRIALEVTSAADEAVEALRVEKLAAADGHERHLFVWIRDSYAGAELAMATLPPPASTPLLPEGLDVVWVATKGGDPDALYEHLWRLQPTGGWEAIGM